MGVVYKARQTKLDRLVALKMILSGGHAGEADRTRFKTEAEAIARLQHPNIVQIYEIGEQDGLPYFSLEFCGGGSLEKKLNGTPLPPKKAAALVETLALAMHAAHEQDVIHRDLKPANVLLANDETLKITDFGLAKKLDGAGQTATGAVMGTPSYMAPEQAGGKSEKIGPPADVYALGAILYECLTGRPPFKAATHLETILQVVSDEPVPPRQLQSRTPRDLETICLKCLRKDPKKRYASAKALAADLRRFQAGEPIKARPVGRVEWGVKWMRRNPAAAALVATLLLGTAVATFFAIRASQKAAEALEQTEIAKTNGRLANARAYISDMRFVQRAWEEHQIGLVHELLEDQRPEKTGGDDLRHFEWHYWWRTSHSELQTIPAYTAVAGRAVRVFDVAFSPDGRRIASCGGHSPGEVKISDSVTGQVVLTLRGHAELAHGVAFSLDGRRLASWGAQTPDQVEVKVWDAVTGKELHTLSGHPGEIRSVAFSPDGRRLASCGNQVPRQGEVKVWDLATGREERTLQVIATRLAFSSDGRRLATLGQSVTIWDAATGQEEKTVNSSPISLITGTDFQDGRCLAVNVLPGVGNTDTLKVWDVFTGQEVLTLQGPSGRTFLTIFSPDLRRMAGFRDGAIRVWDTATGQDYLTLRGDSGGGVLAFSPDGRRLASGGTVQVPGKQAVGKVTIWDVGTGDRGLTLRGHTKSVQGVAFSPDGQRLASTGDGTVKVWEAATGREVLCLRGDLSLSGGDVTFSPDGSRLASCGQRRNQRGEVKVWDAVTGDVIHTLRGHPDEVFSVVFSPDGSRLASRGGHPNGAGEVKVWDAVSGQEIFSESLGTSSHHGVAFSPDGQRLASSGRELVKIWDVATGRVIHTLKYTDDVDGVAFSPDGQRLASACKDQTVRVWDLAAEREVLTLRRLTQAVLGVAYSPDGRRLASCGGEYLNKPGEVKLWDAATGQELLTLRGHTKPVRRVVFSSDGRRLASASDDHTVKVWDATEETPEARQARLARFEETEAYWHLQEAEAAAGASQAYAVAFHLKYLAGVETEAPLFHARRGYLHLRLNQGEKAVADFSRVIEQFPRDVEAWRDRAETYAGLGQWGKAEADLLRMVELAPEDWLWWNRLARVRLAAGNVAGYRAACATLLERFEKTSNAPSILAIPIASTLMLAPDAVADTAQPLRLVEKAMGKNYPNSGILTGVLYRAGKYDLAVQRLNEVIAAHPKGGDPFAWLFLAMSHQRLGRHDEAKKSFAKATSLIDDKTVAALPWEGLLEWTLVREEAESLIRPKDP
jgi:WD40 repeat protein/tetratricopeptide (TPR) repeat protein/tRNA A-37 threonylcarbamoyl transferase component Bud32